MKTTNTKKEAAAPANVRPSSVSKSSKAQPQAEAQQREFIRHCENRKLSTETVLNHLRTRSANQYELAEVVGKWIWLDCPKKTGFGTGLWALGFHWNSRRGVWQHPCGEFGSLASHPADPRQRYGSYFAASKTA